MPSLEQDYSMHTFKKNAYLQLKIFYNGQMLQFLQLMLIALDLHRLESKLKVGTFW